MMTISSISASGGAVNEKKQEIINEVISKSTKHTILFALQLEQATIGLGI